MASRLALPVATLEARVMAAAPALAGAALAATAGSVPALCPFRAWSGHACPLCGMTRSFASMVSGDITTSFRYHPLLLLVVLEVALFGFIYARNGRQASDTDFTKPLLIFNGSVFAIAWLVRWRYGLLNFVVEK